MQLGLNNPVMEPFWQGDAAEYQPVRRHIAWRVRREGLGDSQALPRVPPGFADAALGAEPDGDGVGVLCGGTVVAVEPLFVIPLFEVVQWSWCRHASSAAVRKAEVLHVFVILYGARPGIRSRDAKSRFRSDEWVRGSGADVLTVD